MDKTSDPAISETITAAGARRRSGRKPVDKLAQGDALYAIVSAETRGFQSWIVALSRSRQLISMSFPHLRYGDEEPALAVAKACRDAVLGALRPLSNRDVRTIVRRNRTEGMPGVFFSKETKTRRATWIADISLPDGRSRRSYFPVSRYGDNAARRMAERARQQMLEEVENIDEAALRNPEAKAIEEAMRDVDPDTHAIVGVVRETGRQGEGWRASAPFGGRMLHKRFADRSLGSEAAALAVATAWRDAVAALDARVAPQRRGRKVEAPLGVQFRAASAKHGAAWVAKTVSADGRCGPAPLRPSGVANRRRASWPKPNGPACSWKRKPRSSARRSGAGVSGSKRRLRCRCFFPPEHRPSCIGAADIHQGLLPALPR